MRQKNECMVCVAIPPSMNNDGILAVAGVWLERENIVSRYQEVYANWKRDPVGFWAAAAEEIDWIKPATKIFDARQGQYGRWFAGAQCNTAFNCLDRHVITGKRPNQLALIYDSPMTGTKRTYTYAQLTDDVAAFAAVLRDKGVTKGDRVIVYMPMIPEAVIGMLACARLGAIQIGRAHV